MRRPILAAVSAAATLASTPSTTARYAAAADRYDNDLTLAIRDATTIYSRIRTAGHAYARAERFDTAADRFATYGPNHGFGSLNPAAAARHRLLAKSLRAHARTLPAR